MCVAVYIWCWLRFEVHILYSCFFFGLFYIDYFSHFFWHNLHKIFRPEPSNIMMNMYINFSLFRLDASLNVSDSIETVKGNGTSLTERTEHFRFCTPFECDIVFVCSPYRFLFLYFFFKVSPYLY